MPSPSVRDKSIPNDLRAPWVAVRALRHDTGGVGVSRACAAAFWLRGVGAGPLF